MPLRALGWVALAAIFIGFPHLARAGVISGTVVDAETGEALAFSSVQIEGPGVQRGVSAGPRGDFFFGNLDAGTYELRAFYVGYAALTDTVRLAEADSVSRTLSLVPEGFQVETVKVEGERITREEAPPGLVSLDSQDLSAAPWVGEQDPIRTLQLLPGIQAASDISSGLYVRGGGPDQTLILLDRVPVYNPSHAFGLFSTFNADAVDRVDLYKGAYPAEYSGRLGSVLDIRSRDGSGERTGGRGGLSILAGRLLVEGPVGSGSWILSGRRTYLDPVLTSLRRGDSRIPSYYFYDLEGGLNLAADKNTLLRVTGYTGHDALGFDLTSESELDLTWGNRTAGIELKRILGENTAATFLVSGSEYESNAEARVFKTPVSIENRIRDLTLGADLTATRGRHRILTGVSGSLYDITYKQVFNLDEGVDYASTPGDVSAFAEDKWEMENGTTLRGGLRGRYFSDGDRFLLEPRLSVTRPVSDKVALKLAGGVYHQVLQLVSTEGLTAFDFYLPVDETARPGQSVQGVAGVTWTPEEAYQLSAETYYTRLRNLLTFDNNAPAEHPRPTTDDVFVTGGQGFATGIELFAQKRTGRVRGWIGYALGWTRRTFSEVNQGKSFAPKYDRRHDLKLVGSYRTGPWEFSAAFVYGTGQAYTPAVARFAIADPALGTVENDGFALPGDKNSARLLPYNRLDLSVKRDFSLFGLPAEWFFQIFNVYNRRNEWFIQFDTKDLTVAPEVVNQLPLIPTIGVNFEF